MGYREADKILDKEIAVLSRLKEKLNNEQGVQV